ncbi:hypothetical protein ATO8_11134 [Roseivivax marinus]|jgi:hypothetical protein|uniref:Hint domain-containing protein n=1 Tax=Roseivivax marinus TaxID=1379903 RepID=W4HIJ9_9RHOB|nr:Hint domain-containing protein [Roseivivax marinus]ETW12567.1 hypothetical protein ATO8_11134 [Roseivivax marinus]UMA65840.1 Hint domain-containing protein [Roseivivax marinus]SEL14662.1 Hint domain-containing protein [Roseivivax marinus]
MRADAESRPAQSVSVYRAGQFRVSNGANLGDGISFCDELMLDDIYRLSPVAAPVRLSLLPSDEPSLTVGPDGDVGRPGADIHLDCALTFMSGDGSTTEALVMVETDAEGNVDGVYLLPLAPLRPRADYALVGIDRDRAAQVFAQVACVSFTRGTMITMASGAQRAIETLEVGDRVLTRDDGVQEIRWIGHSTVRAIGEFAPIVIRAGTLNNINDLIVSPDHRLFIYQRTDRLGAGRSELLVKARHLVNGDSVTRMNGGFVDYYQMLFDHHQIIYAEGIAAESMLIDTRTRGALPADLPASLDKVIPGHRADGGHEIEVQESLLRRADAAEILRRSSSG